MAAQAASTGVAGLVLILGTACATNDCLRLAAKSVETQRLESAVEHLEKGASEGDARCDYQLARLLVSGDLGEPDPEAASRWLHNAAIAEIPDAQYDLAELYRTGAGVERDPVRAADWYRRAADAGLPAAQARLGSLYAAGDGVERDPVVAAEWFRRAAEDGDASGQEALGVASFRGDGVPRDVVEGYVWTRLAADQGSVQALKNLPAIVREMSDGELEAARNKVSKLRSQQSRTKHLLRRERRSSRDSTIEVYRSQRSRVRTR